MGSLSFTSRADFFFNRGSFSYTSRAAFIFILGVCLTHPVLASFLSGECLLNISCWIHFYVGSFSYTSCAVFIFMQSVSVTYPMLSWFLCNEFLLHIPYFLILFFVLLGECFLHIPCWLHFYLGTFYYTSHAGFIFIGGVPLTCPVLALFLCG